jgi:hypothetical protein
MLNLDQRLKYYNFFLKRMSILEILIPFRWDLMKNFNIMVKLKGDYFKLILF